ncbi:hypothetical protein [Maridesulfovibrio ferrireducens]|uniref:hypothetical protein n=1 Tax=Maridesulfovibrio ferrireducens TaxID=246191 RepID=UPI001A33CE9B|nr:hypothetical protein [Maridesulfovibrio ferrireducens]MBI9110286.1 hypothetical protein [Maridesulfovibrio ferrireducens]
MMKVKLKKRWGSHLANSIVSVSEERAEFLEKNGIGKITDKPKEVSISDSESDSETEDKSDPEDKADKKAKKNGK